MKLIIIALFFPLGLVAQIAPKKTNTINVKGVTFMQVCNALLDQGYRIAKRDSELQTVDTEHREYEKSFNAAFIVHIRVKDSTAIITGNFFAPWWDPFTKNAVKTDRLWDNMPVWNATDRKGNTKVNSLQGYPFDKMNQLAKSLNGIISYETK